MPKPFGLEPRQSVQCECAQALAAATSQSHKSQGPDPLIGIHKPASGFCDRQQANQQFASIVDSQILFEVKGLSEASPDQVLEYARFLTLKIACKDYTSQQLSPPSVEVDLARPHLGNQEVPSFLP